MVNLLDIQWWRQVALMVWLKLSVHVGKLSLTCVCGFSFLLVGGLRTSSEQNDKDDR
jgi:hypothetical protein